MTRKHIVTVAVTALLPLVLLGWGAVAGAGEGMGVIAANGAAQVAVADQPDAASAGAVVIDKVVAPKAAFVVVHQDLGGMPGARVGFASVPAGTSREVRVQLEDGAKLTPKLIVAVHADNGRPGKLEFDMKRMATSPDRPFFVAGNEVARSFTAAAFGVPVKMGEAAIEAADQPAGASVKIAYAVAPEPAFVVVHLAKPDGMPGQRVGYTAIPAGENRGVEVKLDKPLTAKTKLLAAIHVDRGAPGKLEFDMTAPVASLDQPFFADGMEVAAAFTVGPFGVPVDEASLTATDQIGASDTLIVDKVVSPGDAWVVVHKEVGGAPGPRVGLARVTAGTTENVRVPLGGVLPERLLVALHADRGTSEQFDFDMMDKFGPQSADHPYFVDGKEVAVAVKVKEFGYATPKGTAAIEAASQAVKNGTLRVNLAVAPEPAWIVVHQDAGGAPGARVGLMYIPAGTTRGAIVQLDVSKSLTDTLFVAVHADRGVAARFEFDMMDRANSADQPFFVDGGEVATAVRIR